MIYLAPAIGKGTPADPFRPSGEDSSKSDWISLYDPTTKDPASQVFILHLDSPSSDSRLTAIGADKGDSVLSQRLNAINAKLGIKKTLQLGTTADLVAELLLSGERCPKLQPNKGRYEIWLNGESLWSMAGIRGGALYSTGFAVDEDPLSEGGIWTNGPGNFNPLVVVSGQVRGSNFDLYNVAYLNTPSFNAAHYSQLDIVTTVTANQLPGPAVRIQAGDGSHYAFTPTYAGTNSMRVYRWDSTSLTAVGAAYSLTRSNPDTAKLAISGSTLTPSFNGAAQATRSDATYSTGQPGVSIYYETSLVNSEGDNFEASDGLSGFVPYPISRDRFQGGLVT